ncbi:MAG TPA: hypothetical protein VGM98_11190 [Schlesneria sp.]|jgi:hypothetical protein
MSQSTVSVNCPLETNVTGFVSLKGLKLTGDDSKTWTEFVTGLRNTGATVNGSAVNSTKDALRWLMHQMRDG